VPRPVVLVHGWGSSFELTWVATGITALLEDAGRPVVGHLGRDPGMGRLGQVQDDHPVPAVRRPFPGHGGVPAVGGHLHVVHGPGVHLDRIGLDDVARIGHVPDVPVPVGPLGPGQGVIPSVEALEDPGVRGADPLLATLFSLIGMRCGLAALFTFMGMPVVWVYAALVGDYLLKTVMLIWRFRSGKWKTVVRIDKPGSASA